MKSKHNFEKIWVMFDTPMFLCLFCTSSHDEQGSERWGEEESDQ